MQAQIQDSDEMTFDGCRNGGEKANVHEKET